MKNSKKFWISLCICSVCTFLTAWLMGVFGQTDAESVFRILSDSFLVVGMVAICIALHLFASNEGTFDMIAYGLQTFWGVFRKDMSRKYDTFYDYRVARQEKKAPFLFLLACGGIFLLVSVAMYVAYSRC